MYHGKSFYSADNPRTFTSGEAAECLRSIDRGMTWLGSARGNKDNGYYLYGIERTGVASGRKYFGGENWFHRTHVNRDNVIECCGMLIAKFGCESESVVQVECEP